MNLRTIGISGFLSSIPIGLLSYVATGTLPWFLGLWMLLCLYLIFRRKSKS